MKYTHHSAEQTLIPVDSQQLDQVQAGCEIQTGVDQQDHEIGGDEWLVLPDRMSDIDDKKQKIESRSEFPSTPVNVGRSIIGQTHQP